MKDPFKLYGFARRFPGMNFIVRNTNKKPYIGVTQGGSSRPGHPAKVAATKAEVKQQDDEDGRRRRK